MSWRGWRLRNGLVTLNINMKNRILSLDPAFNSCSTRTWKPVTNLAVSSTLFNIRCMICMWDERWPMKTLYHCGVNSMNKVDHWWWDHPRAMYSTQHLHLHDGAARGGLRVSLEGLLRRDLGAASPGGCELWSCGVTKDWRRCCAFFVILNLRFLEPTWLWTGMSWLCISSLWTECELSIRHLLRLLCHTWLSDSFGRLQVGFTGSSRDIQLARLMGLDTHHSHEQLISTCSCEVPACRFFSVAGRKSNRDHQRSLSHPVPAYPRGCPTAK